MRRKNSCSDSEGLLFFRARAVAGVRQRVSRAVARRAAAATVVRRMVGLCLWVGGAVGVGGR